MTTRRERLAAWKAQKKQPAPEVDRKLRAEAAVRAAGERSVKASPVCLLSKRVHAHARTVRFLSPPQASSARCGASDGSSHVLPPTSLQSFRAKLSRAAEGTPTPATASATAAREAKIAELEAIAERLERVHAALDAATAADGALEMGELARDAESAALLRASALFWVQRAQTAASAGDDARALRALEEGEKACESDALEAAVVRSARRALEARTAAAEAPAKHADDDAGAATSPAAATSTAPAAVTPSEDGSRADDAPPPPPDSCESELSSPPDSSELEAPTTAELDDPCCATTASCCGDGDAAAALAPVDMSPAPLPPPPTSSTSGFGVSGTTPTKVFGAHTFASYGAESEYAHLASSLAEHLAVLEATPRRAALVAAAFEPGAAKLGAQTSATTGDVLEHALFGATSLADALFEEQGACGEEQEPCASAAVEMSSTPRRSPRLHSSAVL